MKKGIGIVALVAGLVVVGFPGTQVIGDRLGLDRPVYSLAQVEHGLRHQPAAWVGKAVRVRARISLLASPCTLILGGCGLSPTSYYALEDVAAGSNRFPVFAVPPLVLQLGAEDPLYQTLQQIPVLQNLVPGPPLLQAEQVTTVRLEPSAQKIACGVVLCYQALLLGPPPRTANPLQSH